MCLEEKIVFESFENENNNYKELKDLIIQRILLESKMYDLLYPRIAFSIIFHISIKVS